MAQSACVRRLLAAIGVLAVSWPCAAQVRINEVSPVPVAGGAPWLELFVEHATDPSGWGLLLPRGAVPDGIPWSHPSESSEAPLCVAIPDVHLQIPDGEYVLVVFSESEGDRYFCDRLGRRWSYDGNGWHEDTTHPPCERPPGAGTQHPPFPLEVHVPAFLATGWMADRGWVGLVSSCPAAGESFPVADFVAWGGPLEREHDSMGGLVWPRGAYVPLYENFGSYDPRTEVEPGDSIGRIPGTSGAGPRVWVRFRDPQGCGPLALQRPCEVTRGTANPVPRPEVFNLADGGFAALGAVGLAWPDREVVDEYQLQVVQEEDPATSVIDVHLRSAAVRLDLREAGRYSVRLARRVGLKWSQSSEPFSLNVSLSACDCQLLNRFLPLWAKLVCSRMLSTPQHHVIASIRPALQRKDTCMYCGRCSSPWGGSFPLWAWAYAKTRPEFPNLAEVNPPSALASSASIASKLMPNCRPVKATACPLASHHYPFHGSDYCVPASVSMVASAYGQCLSQDRVSYFLNGGPVTTDDELGHAADASIDCSAVVYSENQCEQALTWALGWPALPFGNPPPMPDLLEVLDLGSTPTTSELQVKAWLNFDRPLMVAVPAHVHVVAGYCIEAGLTKLLIYDPMEGPRVEKFATWFSTVARAWAAPSVQGDEGGRWRSRNGRSDDLEIWLDGDHDHLVDFDELRRFSTNPSCSDTDDDGVTDVLDLPVSTWWPPVDSPYSGPP